MRAFVIASALLMTAAMAGAEGGALPAPNEPSAGATYADAVDGAADERAKVALATFDEWIAAHPSDVGAAAERCRFLDRVAYDAEGESLRFGAEADSCAANLERDFGDSLFALAYLVENAWGDEAFAAADRFFASGGEGSSLELAVRRRLVEILSYHAERKSELVSHARRAMSLDAELDLSYEVALGLQAQGDVAAARAELSGRRFASSDPWKRAQIANLLHELGEHEASVAEFESAASLGATGDRVAWARSLAALGRLADARAQLRAQIEGASYGGTRRPALRTAVELEIEHGDASGAATAYQALRDDGYSADPLARTRLAVSLAHPAAAWRWRDALGVLALIGAALALALLPLVVLLPVHYVGLRRAARSPSAVPAATLFPLRRAWLACALTFLAQGAAVYALAFDEVVGVWMRETWEPAPPEFSTAQLADLAVWSLGLMALAAFASGWGRLRALLARGEWSFAHALASAFGFLILLRPMAAVIQRLESALAQGSLTSQMVGALHSEYGAVALFGVVAVATPVAEEVLFRGVILAGIARHLSFAWANVVQAALFAAFHEQLALIPFYFAVGVATGWLTQSSRSLRAAVLLHAMNNAVSCAGLVWVAARAPG